MSSDATAATQLSAIVGFRLVTPNLPRLCQFYQDVLGFMADGTERPIAQEELDLLGVRGAGRRQTLRLGGQVVALDQFATAGRPYPDHGNAASLWFQHLALVVADMTAAYRRVMEATPISKGGPQHLPKSSGGVHAFKFRDLDGHPLELLKFPAQSCPAVWQDKSAGAGQIGLGIDHSAISVADTDTSTAFYRSLGLEPGNRSLNQGPEQQKLDQLEDVQVAVAPMQPQVGTPHLELLGYCVPRGEAGPPMQANDIAATRVVWQGTRGVLLRDPDGHLQQIISGTVS